MGATAGRDRDGQLFACLGGREQVDRAPPCAARSRKRAEAALDEAMRICRSATISKLTAPAQSLPCRAICL
jgi:hypothetical protein